jgi:hypothetical protein
MRTVDANIWRELHADWADFLAASGLQRDVEIDSTGGDILLLLREADLRARVLPVLE